MPESNPPPAPAHDPIFMDREEDAGMSIDFGRIFEVLKKHFWLILLYLVIAGVAAVAYLNIATPIYQSFALLKVEQRVTDAAPDLMGGGGIEDLRGIEMIATIQRSFLSRTLMTRVAEKLKLENRASFFPPKLPEADRSLGWCVVYLQKNTTAEAVRGTRLIQIAFDHPDTELATEVTDALVNEYIALDGELRLKSASGNIGYLLEEAKRLKENLQKSEEQLSKYTMKLGSVSVDNEMNIIADQLRELNSRLTVAKADRLKLEADFAQIQNVRDDPQALLGISSVQLLPAILNIRTQLNDLDAEISKTLKRYGPDNPRIAELASQRESLQNTLYAEALQAPNTVEITLRAALQNEKSLERESKLQEKKTLEVKELAIQSSVLQRQIDADKIAYQATLTKLNDESSQARSQSVFLQVVDPASPAFQVKPKPLIVIAIAVIGALGISAATIFLLAILDTSIKSTDEAEHVFGIPVLAAVSRLEGSARKLSRQQKGKRAAKDRTGEADILIPIIDDPLSTVSEGFRTLRASLLLQEESQPMVLLTSAIPGEGKSFCSINLAVAFAQQDLRTVLIDADLRRPVIEARLFDGPSQMGLSDFLMGRATVEEIIRPSHVPNLWVIPGGRGSSNPSELLSRKARIAELLDHVREKFDHAVVDSAPVLAVSDTLSLARHFRNIALVVRSHKTARRLCKRAIELLARIGHPACGVALNQVPVSSSTYYHYYYGQGSHHDASGQGSPPELADTK